MICSNKCINDSSITNFVWNIKFVWFYSNWLWGDSILYQNLLWFYCKLEHLFFQFFLFFRRVTRDFSNSELSTFTISRCLAHLSSYKLFYQCCASDGSFREAEKLYIARARARRWYFIWLRGLIIELGRERNRGVVRWKCGYGNW